MRALLDDLRTHRLDWNEAWLREQAAAFEAGATEANSEAAPAEPGGRQRRPR